MEFNKLITDFENSLRQERERNEQAEITIRKLEWENANLNMSVSGLERLIEDEHPEIQRLINVIKSKEQRLSDIRKELSKKDAEIQRLKGELIKSEKFTSDHVGFLMEVLRREPLRVVIQSE